MEPVYSTIDSYPTRGSRKESKRRQTQLSDGDGFVLFTNYEDVEQLLPVRPNPVQNESDSDSSWDEDLGDGQVEIEIYEDKDACFIETDEFCEDVAERGHTIINKQQGGDDALYEDVSPDEPCASPSRLIPLNETDSPSKFSEKKCDVNVQEQIALCHETLTVADDHGCSSGTNRLSSNSANNYEPLGDTSDNHHYRTVTPPNMNAIHEEMERDGNTAEQVLTISRANVHSNDDDTDDDDEDPVTDYA